MWFGVLLCVTLQTSFMHPPFGFALFYLRGIAPREVKSSDIYWGALPWVGLQLVMVAIVIAWPQLVTGFIPKVRTMDPAKVEIRIEPAFGERPGDEDRAAREIERALRESR